MRELKPGDVLVQRADGTVTAMSELEVAALREAERLSHGLERAVETPVRPVAAAAGYGYGPEPTTNEAVDPRPWRELTPGEKADRLERATLRAFRALEEEMGRRWRRLSTDLGHALETIADLTRRIEVLEAEREDPQIEALWMAVADLEDRVETAEVLTTRAEATAAEALAELAILRSRHF